MGVFQLGSFVIASNDQTDADVSFNTPVNAPSREVEIPAGQRISTCWYVPADNIASLAKFKELTVFPDNNPCFVKLKFSIGDPARLRINIYCATA